MLGLVPTVNLIDEQDRAFAIQLAVLDGFIDHFAQARFAIEYGRKGFEVRLRLVGDHLGQGGFSRSGRSPENDRSK